MDAKLRRAKHRATEEREKQLRERLLEACEQLGVRKNLRERDEPHRRTVGERTEGSAEANPKTELQTSHDLQRKTRWNPDGTEQGEAQQTELRWSRDFGFVEDPHVRLLLRLRSTDLGTAGRGAFHRHRLACLAGPHRGPLQRHRTSCRKMVQYEQVEAWQQTGVTTRKKLGHRRKIQRRGAERSDHRVCGNPCEKLRLHDAWWNREEEGQGNQEGGHQKGDHLLRLQRLCPKRSCQARHPKHDSVQEA